MADPTRTQVWLGKPGGDRLSLRLAQYQYPALNARSDNQWDRNWLRVEGHVESSWCAWRFNDPCMLTSEWQSLIDWARSLPHPTLPEIHFLEPLIAWRFSNRHANVLSVTLRGETLPKEHPKFEERWKSGVTLTLDFHAKMLDEVVAAWAADAATFPPR